MTPLDNFLFVSKDVVIELGKRPIFTTFDGWPVYLNIDAKRRLLECSSLPTFADHIRILPRHGWVAEGVDHHTFARAAYLDSMIAVFENLARFRPNFVDFTYRFLELAHEVAAPSFQGRVGFQTVS